MENPNQETAKATQSKDEDKEELKSVLALHPQQLMEAKTIDSDLDLSFQHQMHEAVTASLSLHHPSTTQDVTVLPPSEMGFDYLTLMLEDIGRFEIERKGMEETEEEMRKLRNDLNRSIHDQNFAGYIINGNVETGVVSSEGFRVYVIGLEVKRG